MLARKIWLSLKYPSWSHVIYL